LDHEVVKDFLGRARETLREAEELLDRIEYALCVSRSQECIELSLKAAVLLTGAKYSTDHDVGGDLIQSYQRFPDWFKKKIPRFAVISRAAYVLSMYAKYGYERLQAPASDLFGKHDASCCVDNAREILIDCERFFHEEQSKSL